MNEIAAELALDCARHKVSLAFAEHVPGTANDDADALSRLHMPAVAAPPYTVPQHLLRVRRAHPAPFEWTAG